jgi:hypothetical protein
MKLAFFVPVANDSIRGEDPECAVHVLCVAESRMEAIELIRSAGITGASAKRVTTVRSARWVPDHLPDAQEGEVWVKPAYVEEEWVRRL